MKILAFAGVMAALSNILSIEPLAIPITIEPSFNNSLQSSVNSHLECTRRPMGWPVNRGYSVLGFPVAY